MAALLFTRGVLCRGADHPQRRAPRQASAARRAPWLETVRHHVPWPHSAALIFCMAPIRPYTQVKPRRRAPRARGGGAGARAGGSHIVLVTRYTATPARGGTSIVARRVEQSLPAGNRRVQLCGHTRGSTRAPSSAQRAIGLPRSEVGSLASVVRATALLLAPGERAREPEACPTAHCCRAAGSWLATAGRLRILAAGRRLLFLA